MIHDVDAALRALIERETGIRDVEVVFDAPTRDWAGRRTVPTVDVYLYDIREDLRRRERGVLNEYNADQTRIVGRHLPPRHFKLSYLVTAWTQRPEDEHRLLSALLGAFLKFEALPADLLGGPLAELGLPVPLTVGLPPPEDRGFADVWSALGGELKPSIDVVVSAPMSTGQQFPMGPAVTEPPRFSFGGSGGFPGRESVGISFAPADADVAEGDDAEVGTAGDAADDVGPAGKRRSAAARRSASEADRNDDSGELPEEMTRAGEPARGIGPTGAPDPHRVTMRRRRMTIRKTS